jgi:hypothetical protein
MQALRDAGIVFRILGPSVSFTFLEDMPIEKRL